MIQYTTDDRPIVPGLRVYCAEYPGRWHVIDTLPGTTYSVRIEYGNPNAYRADDEHQQMRKWVSPRSLTGRD
jgi:hypothetical protein